MKAQCVVDKGGGLIVSVPATVKRLKLGTDCPLCGDTASIGIKTPVEEYRRCQACKISWIRGEWHYLVQFAEPEANSIGG